MKKALLTLLLGAAVSVAVSAQVSFPASIEMPEDYVPKEVLMPASPLSLQVLFVGGVDLVQTTPTYGYEAGVAYAKEWHDFIGFTPDETGESLGWVSVNHETVYFDNRIGDGGGMTTFRVIRNANGEIEVVDQELSDGRQGKFFNVDFVNTVGETGMNCGGISSMVDGRIWTAEEWFRGNMASIFQGQNIRTPSSSSAYPKTPGGLATGQGVRDTADFTISSDIAPFDGLTLRKHENFNWMVEIDPKEAVAIRKQYNWGRQPFEGGVVAMDNKTVYLGPDTRTWPFSKFVADTPGDFTSGKLYVYKHDLPEKWVEIDNTDPDKMLNFLAETKEVGATMYDRIEWLAIDTTTGKVYWTETGTDNIGARSDWSAPGAVHDPYHTEKAQSQGLTGASDPAYTNYYGAVWVYDPALDTNYVIIEGGPFFAESPSLADYPDKHLSNPDGLSVMYIDGKSVLVICEDLNGRSNGRMPAGVGNSTCELYMLPIDTESGYEKYTVDDLIRITAVPQGAEITGACPIPGGTLLLNSQHPSSELEFPWNHSLTFAINGFDNVTITDLQEPQIEEFRDEIKIYPNPTTQTIYFNKTSDYAIYNANGQRILVRRNVSQIDVSRLPAGVYYVVPAEGATQKLIVE